MQPTKEPLTVQPILRISSEFDLLLLQSVRLSSLCLPLFTKRLNLYTAGKLRFQAPQLPLVQQGVQLANTQPAGCPEAGEGILITNPFRGLQKKRKRQQNAEIEDCLMLK